MRQHGIILSKKKNENSFVLIDYICVDMKRLPVRQSNSKTNHSNIMEEIIKNIKAQIAAIEADIDKTGNKAAMARVRKATLALEKLGTEFRKVSVK